MRLILLSSFVLLFSAPVAAHSTYDHAQSRDDLLRRAIHAQHHHEFDDALADLAVIIDADPTDAQARLTRAFIFQALGEPNRGLEDCNALEGQGPDLVFDACKARMLSLSGHAIEAFELLSRALREMPRGLDPSLMIWAKRIQADTARRIGRLEDAEKELREALELNSSDLQAQTALADVLLLQDRADDVLTLDTQSYPPLALRHALALRQMGQPFEIEPENNETRDAALKAIEFGNHPSKALELAKINWKTHREPEDARILFRAAISAADHVTANEVITWVHNRDLEDVEFERLVAEAHNPS